MTGLPRSLRVSMLAVGCLGSSTHPQCKLDTPTDAVRSQPEISEPTMETNSSGDPMLTQWFERAGLEDHGARGILLGNEVRGGSMP